MNKACRKLQAARKMPPKFHRYPGTVFDISESEAARWLCRQPEILQYVFDRCSDAGLIVFDPETRMWHGADFEPEVFDNDGWKTENEPGKPCKPDPEQRTHTRGASGDGANRR